MIFAWPKFNQFCLGVSLAVWVFVGTLGTVCAHEYEDGFVERSLTITIRDGVGYGEYQIGLNRKTATQVLEMAEQFRKQAELGSIKKERSGADEDTKLPKGPSAPAVELGPEAKKSAVELKGDRTPKVTPKDGAKTGVGEHLTDLVTIRRFEELQLHWFKGRLKLSCNGQPVALLKVSVEPAARHPFSVVVKFQFSVEAKLEVEGVGKANVKQADAAPKPDSAETSQIDFQVTDGLFDGHHGATRYALRSRGSTMLLQSNVAPVLVRADRVQIDRAAVKNKKAKSPVIQAKLLVGSR